MVLFFFFNDTATTEIYTLSLHDALPICDGVRGHEPAQGQQQVRHLRRDRRQHRSEEHTSELQSRLHLVCRLLLEKKKKQGSVGHPLSHPYPERIQPSTVQSLLLAHVLSA